MTRPSKKELNESHNKRLFEKLDSEIQNTSFHDLKILLMTFLLTVNDDDYEKAAQYLSDWKRS